MSDNSPAQEKRPLLGNLQSKPLPRHVLVIHGGAGTMTRAGSTPEQQAAYKAALSQALESVTSLILAHVLIQLIYHGIVTLL